MSAWFEDSGFTWSQLIDFTDEETEAQRQGMTYKRLRR